MTRIVKCLIHSFIYYFKKQGIEIAIRDEIIFQAAGLELKAWLPIEK